MPNACVAIQQLTQVIERSTAATLMGLEKELTEAAHAIKASNPTSISLAAGCELYIRYVTRTQALEFADLKTAKQWLIQRGKQFGDTSLKVLHFVLFAANWRRRPRAWPGESRAVRIGMTCVPLS